MIFIHFVEIILRGIVGNKKILSKNDDAAGKAEKKIRRQRHQNIRWHLV